MPLIVRIFDATPDDALSLARIHRNARARSMPWLAVVHTDLETDEWMADVVLANQRVRVAECDGESVGFSATTDGWLEQLYVDPRYQCQGIGSQLFWDVCNFVDADFQFWVFQRNLAARRFYERHGCRLVRMTDGMENEEREPDVLYEKQVASRQ